MRPAVVVFALLILPLTCGGVAYVRAKSAAPAKESITAKTASQREPARTIDDLDAALESEREREQEAIAAVEEDPVKRAKWLKNVILDGMTHLNSDLISDSLNEAAGSLGEIEGKSGVDWVFANARELGASAMDGWAKVDPDAAFEEVATNHRVNPCRPDTLIELLDHQASQGGAAALLAAIDRAPWTAFPKDPFDVKAAGPPQSLAFDFPDDASLAVWIESGALEKIAGRGVPLSGVFVTWSQTDLEGATKGWLAMPHSPWEGSRDFASLLGGEPGDEDRAISLERFRSIYSQASPENQEAIRKYVEENGIGSPEQQSALRSITGQDETKPAP